MRLLENGDVVVEPGKYWLGDPCRTVQDENWDDLLDSCNHFEDSPIGEVDGVQVLAFETKWGDGLYRDQRYRKYPVDAGLIGLVPVGKFIDEEGGRKVVFREETVCRNNNGVLVFGSTIINTDDE